MERRGSGSMIWVTAAAAACLLGVATARISAAQGASEPALVSEKLFRDIQVLKGIPVDTFFDVMGMFAAAMGGDCTFCHAKDAVFRHEAFGDSTPRIQRARQMIVMMQAINKSYFGASPRVTCFTCHHGNNRPAAAPDLALQYGPPEDDPNLMDFPVEPQMAADQILDRYLQSLGGGAALGRLTSFVARGTYAGFDTGFKEVPLEIFAKAPNQRTWIVRMPDGDSRRVFDGRNAWWAGPDSPAPIETLTSGNLDRYRLEALVAFPGGIKQAFSQWKVGRTAIDDRPTTIVQGISPGGGLLPVNLYFDNQSGLLTRWVRWNATPVGPVPTQIDYTDYRDVAGVRMPFAWTVSQTYMQATIKLSAVDPNATIDAARFARP